MKATIRTHNGEAKVTLDESTIAPLLVNLGEGDSLSADSLNYNQLFSLFYPDKSLFTDIARKQKASSSLLSRQLYRDFDIQATIVKSRSQDIQPGTRVVVKVVSTMGDLCVRKDLTPLTSGYEERGYDPEDMKDFEIIRRRVSPIVDMSQ